MSIDKKKHKKGIKYCLQKCHEAYVLHMNKKSTKNMYPQGYTYPIETDLFLLYATTPRDEEAYKSNFTNKSKLKPL